MSKRTDGKIREDKILFPCRGVCGGRYQADIKRPFSEKTVQMTRLSPCGDKLFLDYLLVKTIQDRLCIYVVGPAEAGDYWG